MKDKEVTLERREFFPPFFSLCYPDYVHGLGYLRLFVKLYSRFFVKLSSSFFSLPNGETFFGKGMSEDR
jgi:hypothetical protein